jgi:organic radical activating enzyme
MKEIEQTILKVNEIFYTLQGEGARAGQASIFIRLSKCNLKCGFCDTEFETYKEMIISDIYEYIKKYPGTWIVWTGGEPCLQLTDEIIRYFYLKGYRQAIETNGTLPIPSGLDYVVISPKSNDYSLFEALSNKYGYSILELRYVFKTGCKLPEIKDLPRAKNYYLSPLFLEDNKMKVNEELLQDCVSYCLKNPEWKLSIQQHKFWNIK